ncbi:hypothetical protein ABZ746_17400 [Streptomyces sp. NPDC020096]|nr:hypothetical protein [Streptomyces sp. RPT161]
MVVANGTTAMRTHPNGTNGALCRTPAGDLTTPYPHHGRGPTI